MDDLLDEMLDLWDAGQVVVGKDLLYEVRWLGDHDSRTVAREVFDTETLIKSVPLGHRCSVRASGRP